MRIKGLADRLFNLSERRAALIMKVAALLLAALNCCRVVLVPVTCDEAPSRSDMQLGYGDYVVLSKVTANVHILNSILRKACIGVFGDNQIALRLPSVLAGLLFLGVCYHLARRLCRSGFWQLITFITLTLNPFLAEFWGLSRGYGLAIAFMSLAIALLLRFGDSRRLSLLAGSLVAGMLAVWSNFALLSFWFGLCAAALLIAWRQGALLRTCGLLLAASAGLAALIAGPIMKLQAAQELYYGGTRGLFSDTLCSLVQYSLFVENPAEPIISGVALACVAVLTALSLFWLLTALRDRRRPQPIQQAWILLLLLLVPLLSIEMQHALLGTKYLIDRTALFLSVLFWLNVSRWLIALARRWPRSAGIFGALLAAAITLNFVQHLSLSRSQMWAVDNYNREALRRMLELHPRPGPIHLRAWWGNIPSLGYYADRRHPGRFAELPFAQQPLQSGDTAYDFIYMPVSDTAGIPAVFRLDTVYGELNCLFYKPEL